MTTYGRGSLGYLLNILFEADLSELVCGRRFSICRIDRPELSGLFTSINNSTRWVFHLSYKPERGEKIENFLPARCQELLRLALGMPEIELEIKSILPWESAMRVVDGFQQGRVFFAGDAAHQMPPWGGQGANTGIADVHNLAWKLAAVLKGRAAPALLATYDSERRPVGFQAAAESAAAADAYGLLRPGKVGSLPALLHRAPRLLGYGYEYTSQAIIPEPGARPKGLLRQLLTRKGLLGLDGRPGTHAPHLWVEHEGQRISTLDLFGQDFVLLTGPDGQAWRPAASAAAAHLSLDLVAYCLGPDGDVRTSRNTWPTSAGISTQGALLVRPDGFVAWRARKLPDNPLQALQQTLTHILALA